MGASPTITYGARARRVQVLLPLPLRGAYDYRVPDDLALEAGDFVSVPLGARDVTGVVWDDAGGQGDGIGDARLKDVRGRLDTPPLPADLRRLVDWVANYTLSPPGAVLRMAMSVPKAIEPPPARTAFTRGGAVPQRLTPARRRVLDVLAAGAAAHRVRSGGRGRGESVCGTRAGRSRGVDGGHAGRRPARVAARFVAAGTGALGRSGRRRGRVETAGPGGGV